jgi:hypothetical protein
VCGVLSINSDLFHTPKGPETVCVLSLVQQLLDTVGEHTERRGSPKCTGAKQSEEHHQDILRAFYPASSRQQFCWCPPPISIAVEVDHRSPLSHLSQVSNIERWLAGWLVGWRWSDSRSSHLFRVIITTRDAMRWLKEGSIFKVYNSRFTSSSHTTVAQQISSWIVNELETATYWL